MKPGAPTSGQTVAIALVAIVAIVAAAVLFVSGDNVLERLGVLVGIAGLVIPLVASLVKADQAAASSHRAAEQTNGSLDARIAAAVAEALQARRVTDRVVVHEEPRPADPPA